MTDEIEVLNNQERGTTLATQQIAASVIGVFSHQLRSEANESHVGPVAVIDRLVEGSQEFRSSELWKLMPHAHSARSVLINLSALPLVCGVWA